MNQIEDQPIVCDLTAIPADRRQQHLLSAPRIFQAAQEVRELPTGYAFRLPNEPDMWMALANFVEHERRCCPFWRFGLTIEPQNGPLWLELTGVEGAKELLTAALSESRGAAVFSHLIQTSGESHLDQTVTQSEIMRV